MKCSREVCGETAASASCVRGLFEGTWVVSLPGKIASTGGNPLYAAPKPGNPLYDGDKPRLESCIGWGDSRPDVRTREVSDLQGCVGYDNSPGQASPLTRWTRTYAPESTPANSAPLLRTSIPEGTDRVLLDWSLGSTTPSATYAVTKSTGGGAFAPVAVTTVNATSATDAITSANLGSNLSYRIAATIDGVAASSNIDIVTVPRSLQSAQGLVAEFTSPGSSTDIMLSWNHAPLASGYIVQEIVNGMHVEVGRTTQNSYVVKGTADTSREFVVLSYLGSVTSDVKSAPSAGLTIITFEGQS